MRKPISVLRRYWFWFVVYALLVGLYLWLGRSNTVPEAFRGTAADPAVFMSAGEIRASELYQFQRSWLFFVLSPWEWGVYLLLLASGAARKLQDSMGRRGWPLLVRFPLCVMLVYGTAFASCLPLRFIGYKLSRGQGISTQPLLSWLQDKLVEFGVGVVPAVAGLAAAMWLMRRGSRWWLKLWLASIPLILFMMVIQPVFIDPLYNRYSRLSDPVLEQRILELADKAEVPADRVYEANYSDKSNAYNAYVNGIGPTLRIVLWDTLYRLDENEMMFIVAHEMGHYAMHHLEWSAVGVVGSSLVLLAAGSLLLRWAIRRYGVQWQLRSASELSAVPLLLLALSVLSFASLPVSNLVSRQAERAADQYAMELIGQPAGAVSMNQKLAKATLDDVNPPLLTRVFRFTHPSAMERIHDAEVFERHAAAGE